MFVVCLDVFLLWGVSLNIFLLFSVKLFIIFSFKIKIKRNFLCFGCKTSVGYVFKYFPLLCGVPFPLLLMPFNKQFHWIFCKSNFQAFSLYLRILSLPKVWRYPSLLFYRTLGLNRTKFVYRCCWYCWWSQLGASFWLLLGRD